VRTSRRGDESFLEAVYPARDADKQNGAMVNFHHSRDAQEDSTRKGDALHASPKSVMSPPGLRPPRLIGLEDDADIDLASAEALERRWALAVQFEGVEVPEAYENGCEPCGEGQSCLRRRLGPSAALQADRSGTADQVARPPVVHPTTSTRSAVRNDAANKPAPPDEKTIWPVRVNEAGSTTLHCREEVAYKPPWSPRLGAGAPTGPWESLVINVHALLGCALVVDDSAHHGDREGGARRPSVPLV